MKDINREQAFLKRYGKKVECDVEYVKDKKILKNYSVTIKSPNNSFIIQEFLKEGLTEYVLLTHNNKQWKHTRFLDAEISVADIIGEESGNSR